MHNTGVIQQFLHSQGFATVSDETRSHIDEWLEWYQGDVEGFHSYRVYNRMGGYEDLEHRYSMGMAKKLCEDWASLLLNEKTSIKAGKYEKRLNEILDRNNFRIRGNQLVELSFALGTGAFVEYLNADGSVAVDYVRADMIHPLSWDNGDITECAFGSARMVGNKEQIYLQIHRLGRQEDGENPALYYIENRYIDAESGKELDAQEDVLQIVNTGRDKPLYQIITPNICNNIDLDSPMGVSVYANGISQLKGCDVIYDSYVNEFILGKKRIIVPISMAKMQAQQSGVIEPTFDFNDNVFYQMLADRESNLGITEVDMKIRAQEHELAIQRSLDILSLKTGLGTGRYQFNSSGTKTATEVISDKSDLYQNRQKHAIIIQTAVVDMVRAMSFLDTGKEVEATVDFDDSIIEDVNTTIDKNIKLVDAGLRSKLTAIMEIYKCSEADAKAEQERIAEDGQITGQDIDWTAGDGDNPEDPPDDDNGDLPS